MTIQVVELERKRVGDPEMSNLDVQYLCFSPFKVGPLMLPLAAVPF